MKKTSGYFVKFTDDSISDMLSGTPCRTIESAKRIAEHLISFMLDGNTTHKPPKYKIIRVVVEEVK